MEHELYALRNTRDSLEPAAAGGEGAYSCERPSPEHRPTQNQLLASLPEQELQYVLPELELVPLPVGWVVHRAGGRMRYGYFPVSGIVSPYYSMRDGTAAAFAIAGRESVVGVPLIMGVDTAPSEAVVHCAGHAYRMGAAALRRAFARGGAVQHLLLRYTQVLLTQMAQTALCNQSHSIEQRLSRWLLSSLDRISGNELSMTQCLMAQVLGVRRESVSDVAGKFQDDGLIHYHRGHIAVLDRARMEKRSCECYAEIKSEFARLLPGQGAG